LRPLAKDGFFNFIFFNLSNKPETDFLFSTVSLLSFVLLCCCMLFSFLTGLKTGFGVSVIVGAAGVWLVSIVGVVA